jgi:hypothetical protein
VSVRVQATRGRAESRQHRVSSEQVARDEVLRRAAGSLVTFWVCRPDDGTGERAQLSHGMTRVASRQKRCRRSP